MEEIIFENEFDAAKKEIAREYVVSFWFKNRKTYFRILVATLLVFILGWMNILLQGPLLDCMPLLVGVSTSAIVWLTIVKNSQQKVFFKHLEIVKNARVDGNGDHKLIFRSENFFANELCFEYSQISRIVVGEMCIYLLIEKVATVIVKKDAFTKGEYKEFVSFLKGQLKNKPRALKSLDL